MCYNKKKSHENLLVLGTFFSSLVLQKSKNKEKMPNE